jgi:hypothetical protein
VVHSGRETSTHYVSCLGGIGTDSKKSTPTHTLRRTCVLHLMGSAGHVVQSIASGAQTVNALFFHARVGPVQIQQKARRDMLRQTCVFASGTDSRKSVMGHITPNLCFCIRWDLQVT